MRVELPAYITGKSPVALFDAGPGALPAPSGARRPHLARMVSPGAARRLARTYAPSPRPSRTNGTPRRRPPSPERYALPPAVAHERYARPLGVSMADGDDPGPVSLR
jgi:hypothetical protein